MPYKNNREVVFGHSRKNDRCSKLVEELTTMAQVGVFQLATMQNEAVANQITNEAQISLSVTKDKRHKHVKTKGLSDQTFEQCSELVNWLGSEKADK